MTSDHLARLKQHAPTLVAITLVVLLSLSLTWQAIALMKTLRAPVSAPQLSSASHDNDQPASVELSELFGDAPVIASSAPETNLQLTLEASFVHPDSSRSAAIIRDQQRKAQRYVIDSEISAGVRLLEVHPDHVVLGRGAARESLYYPASRLRSSADAMPAGSVYEQAEVVNDLEQLQDENYQLLRERMESLRQEMSAAGISSDNSPSETEPSP
ncbi:type II secretion system protein N [Atopomonas sediminilitoris]|uniref:type II secretion system protein N n=1 Tax=Atopomonas sediminilitoris TaxID=2919919 RepID=UPI001F4D7729|nr:type II secretion system protein N [Atopomonas sediminilitoris]MCJ8168781.1 hypothetical protein [Atopomonas sediminilitoris]